MIKLLLIYFVISFSAVSEKKALDKTIKTQKQSEKEAVNSQVKINKLDDETQSLLQDYRYSLKKIYNTKKYNEQLKEFLKNQKKEMISLRKQIEEVKDTRKDILPLMSNMLDSLEEFINLDMPFLMGERRERVSNLKEIMKKSNISVSEKYRRLISAYEIENEYGRTISAYKGKQEVNNKPLTVSFLRIGRIAFIYQTLNKKHMAYWDNTEKKWKKLSNSYKTAISNSLSIARKQLAPDLLKIPIPAPQGNAKL